MANFEFHLASGRRVGVTAHGEPDGDRLVVFCHPAPGSSLFDPDPRAIGYRRVHVVGLDRAGYGSSDPLPEGTWPSLGGYASDIAEYLRTTGNIARDRGIEEFNSVGVVGWGAGGRVALALAATHQNLVDRIVVVGTPAPEEELPWMDSDLADLMPRLADMGPAGALGAVADTLRRRGGSADGDDVREAASMLGLGPADRAALALPGVEERLEDMIRDAFRHGFAGLAADIVGYGAREWGFDLGAIRATALLLYGADDPRAGRAHAEWYRDRLASASVETVPEAGQLAVVPAWNRALEFLGGAE